MRAASTVPSFLAIRHFRCGWLKGCIFGSLALLSMAFVQKRHHSASRPVAQLLPLIVPSVYHPVFINGRLTEWDSAATIRFSTNPLLRPAPSTTVKAMWDQKRLYIAFIVENGQVHAQQLEGKKNVWLDNSVEIFLDTQHDARRFHPFALSKEVFERRGGRQSSYQELSREYLQADDFHFIINTLNTLEAFRGKDLSFQKHIYNVDLLSGVVIHQDSLGNQNGYTIEMAIPWQTIALTPAEGKTLGVDFCVNENTSQAIYSYDWCGLKLFNQPHRWGTLVLGRHAHATASAKPLLNISLPVIALVALIILVLGSHSHYQSDSPVQPTAPSAETRSGSVPTRYGEMLAALEQYIAQHHAAPDLTITQAAAHLTMSVRNLQLILRKERNLTFTELVNAHRLMEAERLVSTTHLSVNEICFRIGFSTPSYFIRLFREKYNHPPSEYKKNKNAPIEQK